MPTEFMDLVPSVNKTFPIMPKKNQRKRKNLNNINNNNNNNFRVLIIKFNKLNSHLYYI